MWELAILCFGYLKLYYAKKDVKICFMQMAAFCVFLDSALRSRNFVQSQEISRKESEKIQLFQPMCTDLKEKIKIGLLAWYVRVP